MKGHTFVIGSYSYNQVDFLGKGSFGEVYEGICPEGKVAIKKINYSRFREKDQVILKELTEKEIKSQIIVEHPNTLRLIDVLKDKYNLYLVTELCDCTLEKQIGIISMKQIFIYFKQIIETMIYINNQNVIHRDLKPGNILLKDGQIKIGDYGFARFVEDPTKKNIMTFEVGSPLYKSPELHLQKPYSFKCDVWSIGIILYEMIYGGNVPWTGKSVKDLVNNILNNPLKFPDKPEINVNIKDLLTKMLSICEDFRISFIDILKHEALNQDILDQEVNKKVETINTTKMLFLEKDESTYLN